MRILALDSSGLVASVAVVEDGAVDDQVIAEYTVNYKKTHSQTLLPMFDEIVKMTELDLETGEARFTGRIDALEYTASAPSGGFLRRLVR